MTTSAPVSKAEYAARLARIDLTPLSIPAPE